MSIKQDSMLVKFF